MEGMLRYLFVVVFALFVNFQASTAKLVNNSTVIVVFNKSFVVCADMLINLL